MILFSGYHFKAGVASLGANVRAIPKEDFEPLEQALVGIGHHLQLCPGRPD